MALDRWVENRGVRLHYLESDVVEASGMPIVFIPGRLGSAEHYLGQIEALAPRCCLAMSLRGRGQSDAPSTGYTFTDHVADVEAVIADSGLEYFCLMAYSIGVPFGVEYAARHSQNVAGLILGDYPAHYPAISPQWVENALAYLGNQANESVLRAMQQESADVLLWDHLPQITCPVLLMRGGREGSLLKAEDAEHYLDHLPYAQLAEFPEAGHELWQPDYDRFMTTIKAFLEKLDYAL